MARRKQFRQEYRLDSGNIQRLDLSDIETIIRATEDLINEGGRNLLVKILRGSQAKVVLPEFRKNPMYGKWSALSETEVAQRVDWCIQEEYLQIQYSGKLPLLAYGDSGIAIECRLIASEYLALAAINDPGLHQKIPNVPISTLYALLDLITNSREVESYTPFLKQWQNYATKRFRKQINRVFQDWQGAAPLLRHVFDYAWIDESITFPGALPFLYGFAKSHSMMIGSYRAIAEQHPGLPDVDIYNRLLANRSVCLFTADRTFHNALLQQGSSSFFINEVGEVTHLPLKGVKPRGVLANLEKTTLTDTGNSEPVAQPRHSALASILLPETDSARKKLRTKHRRIRNYFGGAERMEKVSVALSVSPGLKPLIGIRIRVIPGKGSGGIKALDASELYIEETSGDLLSAYIHVMALLVNLQLWHLVVDVYFDSQTLSPPEKQSDSKFFELWQAIAKTFPHLNYHPIGERPRSPQMDKLRQKLRNLSNSKSNEIVPRDIGDYFEKYMRQESND